MVMATRSFTGFRPSSRYDDVPWNRVRIQEAAEEDGTYSVIDTLTLSPLDADPAQPAARNFTTHEATLDDAWYRIFFLDENDHEDQVNEPVHYPIDDGYPTTATVLAETNVAELIALEPEQQEALRSAAIVAIEAYCGQSFENDPETTVLVESAGGYELYLPKHLRSFTDVSQLGGDALALDAIRVDPEGDRICFDSGLVGAGYYEQALYDVSGGDYGSAFPAGTLSITGDWGWETAPPSVATALRYDMEEQALADTNALSSTVHAVRRLGLSSIGQGSLRAQLVAPPMVSPRVERLLADYVWMGTGGKLV